MKKIALGQMKIIYGDFEHNVRAGNDFIETATHDHCDLIVLPELWSSGFDLKIVNFYSQKNELLLTQLQKISDEANITICGSYILENSGRFFNSFVTLQPHLPRTLYNKSHLFRPMHEDNYFSEGTQSACFDSTLRKTGVGICYDLRFPEFFTSLASQGTDCYLLASHWPLSRIAHWDILLQARAIENQSFVIAVNSVLQSGRDIYGGHSAVISPNGEILFQAPADEENVYFVEIDLDEVQSIRKKFVMSRSKNDLT